MERQRLGKPLNSRKTHRKSRLGCGECKRRRIKCDEKKPACNNCVNHGIDCTFSTVETFETGLPVTPDSATHFAVKRYQFRPYNGGTERPRQTTTQSGAEHQEELSRTHRATQWDLSASLSAGGISFTDLDLFHHYTISTYKSIVDDEEAKNIWQNHVIKWSIAFPSIMHLILALSALHLSYERPDQREKYVRQADDHFTFGVRSVTAILSQLDKENCQKMYISAVLICYIYFARGPRPNEYLVFSDSGPAEWLVLMNGVKTILESYRDTVFSGILEPKDGPPRSSICSSLRHEFDEYTTRIQAVQQLVEREVLDDIRRTVYISCITGMLTTLEEVFEKRTAKIPSAGLMQVVIGWLYRLPREIISWIEQKEPVSMIILAHWAIMLKYMRPVWFMKAWDTHVLRGIHASLKPEFRRWIEWPLQQVQ